MGTLTPSLSPFQSPWNTQLSSTTLFPLWWSVSSQAQSDRIKWVWTEKSGTVSQSWTLFSLKLLMPCTCYSIGKLMKGVLWGVYSFFFSLWSLSSGERATYPEMVLKIQLVLSLVPGSSFFERSDMARALLLNPIAFTSCFYLSYYPLNTSQMC